MARAMDAAGNTSVASLVKAVTVDSVTVIEANGSTRLTEVGNHFFLFDSGGFGPSLKYAGTDYVAGQFGGKGEDLTKITEMPKLDLV